VGVFITRIIRLIIYFVIKAFFVLCRKWEAGEPLPWPERTEGAYKNKPRYNKEDDCLYWRVKKMQEERDCSLGRSKAKRKEIAAFSAKDDSPVLSASPVIAISADWAKIEEALNYAVKRLKLAEPYKRQISAVSAIGLLKRNGSIDLDVMGALYELKNIKTRAEETVTAQADVVSYSKAAHKTLRILEAL